MNIEFRRNLEKMRDTIVVQAVRDGLIMAIPIIMIGSFALVLRTLPIKLYQKFLNTFAGGIIADLFSTIEDATLGILSIYLVFSISIAMSKIKESRQIHLSAAFTSVICFVILSGAFLGNPEQLLDGFGSRGTFVAIITTVVSTSLYFYIKTKLRLNLKSFADGVDTTFNNSIEEIIPSCLVVSVFAVFNIVLVHLLDATTFSEFLIELLSNAFSGLGRDLGSALLFVILSSLLWFFGIHGGDALEGVNQRLFEPAIHENMQAIAHGQQATEILSKTFFDIFVLTGGCGAAICLFAAVMIFSRHRSNKKLAKMATLPMIFNINELMLFGLPVVFNPIFFLPFFLTPMVTLLISYIAIIIGLVPVPTVEVSWTTPIFIGGYIATGSIMGSALQLVNLIVGALIYRPFVKWCDKEKIDNGNKTLEKLINVLKESEISGAPVTLTELKDASGATARMLVGDLANDIQEKHFDIYYQPQHDEKSNCIGAEALLRWKHKAFGMIYPPLVIKLAEEAGMLELLEKSIFKRVALDTNKEVFRNHENMKISINISASTIQKKDFLKFLSGFTNDNQIMKGKYCIEVTEQTALNMDEELQQAFTTIHKLGFLLAIDDFSMGATSLKYLQKNNFDLVKIDGGLVKDLDINNTSRNIIASIVYLADSMGFSVIAEFVDTEEKRLILEEVGCKQYQGYLYSPAIPIDEFEEYICNVSKSLRKA
ncbi:MAG: PTS sugar transporter subunit IIC/EAL domain-containing protein [Aminipila sp.]